MKRPGCCHWLLGVMPVLPSIFTYRGGKMELAPELVVSRWSPPITFSPSSPSFLNISSGKESAMSRNSEWDLCFFFRVPFVSRLVCLRCSLSWEGRGQEEKNQHCVLNLSLLNIHVCMHEEHEVCSSQVKNAFNSLMNKPRPSPYSYQQIELKRTSCLGRQIACCLKVVLCCIGLKGHNNPAVLSPVISYRRRR